MDIKLIITVINFAVYRTSESWLCVGNYMQSESLKSLKSRSFVLLPIQILTSTWNIAKYNLTKSISNLVQRNQTEHYKVMIVLTAVAKLSCKHHIWTRVMTPPTHHYLHHSKMVTVKLKNLPRPPNSRLSANIERSDLNYLVLRQPNTQIWILSNFCLYWKHSWISCNLVLVYVGLTFIWLSTMTNSIKSNLLRWIHLVVLCWLACLSWPHPEGGNRGEGLPITHCAEFL